jgi:hypothetical protein
MVGAGGDDLQTVISTAMESDEKDTKKTST